MSGLLTSSSDDIIEAGGKAIIKSGSASVVNISGDIANATATKLGKKLVKKEITSASKTAIKSTAGDLLDSLGRNYKALGATVLGGVGIYEVLSGNLGKLFKTTGEAVGGGIGAAASGAGKGIGDGAGQAAGAGLGATATSFLASVGIKGEEAKYLIYAIFAFILLYIFSSFFRSSK